MKTTAYLYWVADSFYAEGGRYEVSRHDMDGYGGKWKLVGQKEVDFDVADFDPRELLIDSLKAEKAKVISEAAKEAEKLEEKIQQLLALPASAAA